MKAQNLYNASSIVGCRFSFTLPVELPARSHADTGPVPLEAASITNPTAINE